MRAVAMHITPDTVHKTQILFPEQCFENNVLRRTCREIILCAARPPKLPNVEQWQNTYPFFRFFHYITKRLHFPVCVNCNRLQLTSQCVKTKEYGTRRSRVAWLLYITRCDVFCDLLQYTYNKNSNGLLKDFGGVKNEKQVRWHDLLWIWRN